MNRKKPLPRHLSYHRRPARWWEKPSSDLAVALFMLSLIFGAIVYPRMRF